MSTSSALITLATSTEALLVLPHVRSSVVSAEKVLDGRVRSADGVEIAYSERGAGDTAVIFIHRGLADRSFWAPQLSSLAETFRVVALDLAGHGSSGRDRKAWTITALAEDVRAVVEATCRAMVQSLFHEGAQRGLQAWAERRMCAMPPDVVVGIMEGFAGYDLAAAVRAAGVPIRAINGDLWPTAIQRTRTVAPDFDAVILKGAGHTRCSSGPESSTACLWRL